MKINTNHIDKAISIRHNITLLVACGDYTKAKEFTKKYVSYCKKYKLNP